VVVTGAGSGIGRAVALAAARSGAAVAALDIDGRAADNASTEARAHGVAAIAIACDVQSEDAIAAAVERAASLGPIRGLVTAAGIDRGGMAHELPLATWSAVIDTNLTGTFTTCKHVLRQMLRHGTGGSIVCVSSGFAFTAIPGGVSAYAASKGGVSALVRSLALDYAPHGIRVNALLPGATETPLMWANVHTAEVAAMRARVAGQLPMGRLAEPEEIAEAAIWLLGDQASYVSGSQFAADGALLARAHIEA
jgi:NAD(P)-dependent dehydrogenase (short-subunit alcohol dehydrogenase family)